MSREYQLYRNDAFDTTSVKEWGKIVEIKTGKDILYVIYDKDFYKHANLHMGTAGIINGTYIVKFDDMYLKYINENVNAIVAVLYHELGHFVNGDLERMDRAGLSSSDLRKLRMTMISMGRLDANEQAADEFAVKQCGKRMVINMLDFFIEKRKQRNDPGMKLAIREFELRKEAVAKIRMNSTEKGKIHKRPEQDKKHQNRM